MRVIKEVNEEKVHKRIHCKSLYAYTAKDVDWVWYNHIRCPVCNSIQSTSIFDKKVKN